MGTIPTNNGETEGYRAVGFLIKEKVMRKILEIRNISERICFLKMKVGKGVNLLIV